MHTRAVGRTDVRLSEITLGTWGLAQQSYGRVRTERFDETVRSAIEHGVTTFDVAPLWGGGESERRVGAVLKETGLKEGGPDAENTPTIIGRGGARMVDGKLERTFTVDALIADCEASLSRLGRERIDVWLLHGPTEEDVLHQPWREAVETLIAQGKIGAWGMSVSDTDMARLAIAEGAQAICLPYNLLRYQDIEDLQTELSVEGCAVLARSPLMYGMLGGHWIRTKRFGKADHRRNRWTQDSFDERLRQVDELRFLSTQHESLVSAALRFVLSHKSVTTALVGARSPHQVTSAIDAIEDTPPYLDDEDMTQLGKIRESWSGF